MIDFTKEKLLTIAEARARIPGRPSIETLWRWRQGRGCGGRRLETVKVGRRLYVTEKALNKFLREITRDGTPAPQGRERQRRDAAELSKAGI